MNKSFSRGVAGQPKTGLEGSLAAGLGLTGLLAALCLPSFAHASAFDNPPTAGETILFTPDPPNPNTTGVQGDTVADVDVDLTGGAVIATDGVPGVALGNNGEVDVSGGSSIDTTGDNAPAIRIRFGEGVAANTTASVTIDQSSLSSNGFNSDLILLQPNGDTSMSIVLTSSTFQAVGNESSVIYIQDNTVTPGEGQDDTILITGSTLGTDGDDAPVIYQGETGRFENPSDTDRFTTILGTTLSSTGDRSTALYFGTLRNNADSVLGLAGVTINTEGDDSLGIYSGELGADSTRDVTMVNIDITTLGDRSTGFVIGSRSDLNSPNYVGIADLVIVTSGTQAHGLVLGENLTGPNANASLSFNTTTATTSGANAHALIIGRGTTVAFDPSLAGQPGIGGELIQATFDTADGFVASGMGARSIFNHGGIFVGADGLLLGDGVVGNITNNGVIAGTGSVALVYDVDSMLDDIFELQPMGSVAGTVDAGLGEDRFILGGSGEATFDPNLLGTQYLGFETFEKTGDSIWTLAGADNAGFTFGTVIEAGGLIVNANLPNFNPQTVAGARLGGSGTVGNVVNAGTLAPGNSIGTLSVIGNLTLTPTSLLEIEIAGNGDNDFLDISGSATLAGALDVQALNYPSGYPLKQEYTILEADGGVSSTFDTITDNLPDVDVAVTYDPNQVIISYERDEDVSDKSLFPNSLQAGAAAARLFGDGLRSRANSTHHDEASQATSHRIWGLGLGQYTDVDGNNDATGYESLTGGFAIGFDWLTASTERPLDFGIALGLSDSAVDNGPSDADIRSWLLGAYAGYRLDPVRLTGSIAYGRQDYELTRVIPLEAGGPLSAKSDFHADLLSASLRLSHDDFDAFGHLESEWNAVPYFGLDYLVVMSDDFRESGAGVLNQSVESEDYDRFIALIGTRLARTFDLANGRPLTIGFDIAYEHSLSGEQATVDSSIPGLPDGDFRTRGADLNEHLIRLGTQADLALSEAARLWLRYDAALSSDTEGHTGVIGFSLAY